ncbi:hypothetical protein GQ457_10G009420 [Hibiscus cannabinus]
MGLELQEFKSWIGDRNGRIENLDRIQLNKHEVKTNHWTKIKLDIGNCILVRVVSEANKTMQAASFQRKVKRNVLNLQCDISGSYAVMHTR